MLPMHALILRVDTLISKAEYGLLFLLSALISCILMAQVFMRYLLNSPIFWAEEVTVQGLILLTFYGASYCVYLGVTIKVDIIDQLIPAHALKVLQSATSLVCLLMIGTLCYIATEWITRPEVRVAVSATTGIPKWYNYLLMIAAFYCMAWHFMARLLPGHKEPVA